MNVVNPVNALESPRTQCLSAIRLRHDASGKNHDDQAAEIVEIAIVIAHDDIGLDTTKSAIMNALTLMTFMIECTPQTCTTHNYTRQILAECLTTGLLIITETTKDIQVPTYTENQ